jgi:hypothetical protein
MLAEDFFFLCTKATSVDLPQRLKYLPSMGYLYGSSHNGVDMCNLSFFVYVKHVSHLYSPVG